MPVVLVAEELSPAGLSVLSGDFEVRHVDGADRSALLPALADVDAVIVRSATKIDAEALAAAPRLKVVARAGIGLDNVDVPAATTRGVMVVNAPLSNIVSAAEHAIALLLAVARRVPAADAALQNGEWKRSKYTGVELTEKVVGVVGLGRIGQLVAHRLAAFGVQLVAYDPYIAPARAAQMGVRLVDLDELLRISDMITIHLPKTPETLGLIGADELARTKKGVIIVNAARGGLVDEQALADAIRSGQVGGAGVDVFVKEPATSSPLFGLENVVVTPHLGASTNEAQEKAGLAVARSVRLALQGEFVPDAVNVQAGGVVAEDVRPGLPLAEKLGQVFTGIAGGLPENLTVEVRGEITEYDVSVLQLAALKGVFTDVVEEQVTYVNAPLLAKERHVEVALETHRESPDYRNLLTLRGALSDGTVVSISGTLVGTRQVEKITAIDAFEVDLRPEAHLAFFRYEDRPGIVGAVGELLGDASINIANAQVSRLAAGGAALMSLSLDDAVPADILQEIAKIIGAPYARAVSVTVG
ncbi:phosphoglycerate dehydrogenase [Frankia sp. CNm7]|uniref:D-3-phosphoglycerate dehydrogenase n=1 Tax=Frankia nepalensis TaxID=1836974 RepID=A0A937UNQ8_9ACTN|nr:phosphoglycerate dehydrogenase [Frankia nepalensis]MBL7496777.1 phosphoglycerate dehydrogenase [Frankia nepalensis]MBL7511687.1 phosphoglycerate dehydrogenase [Frankia nepalensis]MBL7523539.1 phosphoglycerate dehydrogenase [Frankia nepalensis]MBL7628333.1 phosphoglycerate dehydrogenase [Frankia nepalensis]